MAKGRATARASAGDAVLSSPLAQNNLEQRPGDLRQEVLDALDGRIEIPAPDDPLINLIEPGWSITPERAVQVRLESLMREFAERRRLLQDTISSTQVARLLATTRQTPIDRLHQGTLLAMRDGGSWRFPLWQFDPAGPDGVVNGLPDVLREVGPNPFAQTSWLIDPQAQLDGESPLAVLRRGDVDRVLALAAQIGAV
jgi:hypothetical protein